MYNKEAIYKYRAAHKDKINAYNDVYMKQYYDEKKDNFREYYNNNKKELIEKGQIYYNENREKIKERTRIYYEKVKDIKNLKLKQKRDFNNEWKTLCNISVC